MRILLRFIAIYDIKLLVLYFITVCLLETLFNALKVQVWKVCNDLSAHGFQRILKEITVSALS